MDFERDLEHLLIISAVPTELRQNIPKIVQAILHRIGETKAPTQDLGQGKFAIAYWLKKQKKKVLKITHDPQDAYAMQRVKKHPKKHLITVYDVFEVVPKYLWGIVTEKLTPMDREETKAWQELWHMLSSDSLGHLGDELVQWGLSEKFADELVDAIENPDVEDEDEDEDDGDDGWDRPFYEVPEDELLDALRNWGKDLQSLHIKFYDFHPGNIMTRRHDYVLVDLGAGSVPKTDIPELDLGEIE